VSKFRYTDEWLVLPKFVQLGMCIIHHPVVVWRGEIVAVVVVQPVKDR